MAPCHLAAGRRSRGFLLVALLIFAVFAPQSPVSVKTLGCAGRNTVEWPMVAQQPFNQSAAETVTLADAVLYVGRTGHVSEEGRRILGLLWRDLDPDLSLLPNVTRELNGRYAQQYKDYLLKWSMLGRVARVFCWDFAVTEETVRHFLDGNDVPEPRVVKWMGVDVGAAITWIVRLGEGGDVRGRFQVRVLASLPLQSTTWRDVRFFGFLAFKLYATLLVAHYAEATLTLTALGVVFGIEGVRRVTQKGMTKWGRLGQAASTLIRQPLVTTLAALGCLTGVTMLQAWREVMMPRVALLTTTIHRSLIEQGYLQQGDSFVFCDTPIVQGSRSFLEACRRTAIQSLSAP